MIDYGYANGWVSTPEQVKKCNHKKESETIGNCLTKITCKECGFTYKIDSGD